MATTSGGFYSYIQESGHHDVWKIIVLVFVVAVIVVLGWLFSSDDTIAPTVVPQAVVTRPSLSDAERQAIMATPSGLVADTSLTDKQRTTVMTSSSKTIAPDKTMTDAQRRRLMGTQ